MSRKISIVVQMIDARCKKLDKEILDAGMGGNDHMVSHLDSNKCTLQSLRSEILALYPDEDPNNYPDPE